MVDGKPLATRAWSGQVGAQPRRVSGAADEEVVAEAVDEHDDRPTGGRQVEAGDAGRSPAHPHAEARATLGRTSASEGWGRPAVRGRVAGGRHPGGSALADGCGQVAGEREGSRVRPRRRRRRRSQRDVVAGDGALVAVVGVALRGRCTTPARGRAGPRCPIPGSARSRGPGCRARRSRVLDDVGEHDAAHGRQRDGLGRGRRHVPAGPAGRRRGRRRAR